MVQNNIIMANFFTGPRWENGVMKQLVSLLILLLISRSAFALNCESIFTSTKKNINRPLLNSLKRIRNYGTFESVLITHDKTQRMTLVVFDMFNDGVVGNRKSIDDHVLELRSFASEIRYIRDNFTKNQILVSRLVDLPQANINENLLRKDRIEISIIENLKKTDSIEESFNYEIFQAIRNWLSRPGPDLNVVIIPRELRDSFIMNASDSGVFKFQSLDKAIETIDPLNSK